MTAQLTPAYDDQVTTVQLGAGCARQAAAQLADRGRALVLTTANRRRALGWLFDSFGRQLEATIEVHDTAASSLDSVRALLGRHRGGDYQQIIAVGGGSVMDTAKAVAIGLRHDADFAEILANPAPYSDDVPSLACLPTTSGTGSEVTMWGTVWDLAADKKRSISHPALYPASAWVDPLLTQSLPPRLTAITGFDALSHGLESLWNVHATPASDRVATAAVQGALRWLPTAVRDGADVRARTEMGRAAVMGGLAISRTRTAAAHSVSYPMTIFHDIPHGQACSITLPWLAQFNCEALPARSALIFEALGVTTAAEASARLRRLFEACGMPTRLRDIGIGEDDLQRLAAHAFTPERMANNHREVSIADVQAMLLATW